MGVNVFPAASGGASYSSQPPASASSVLLDGQLVTASSISTSVTGTGAPWLLYANGAGTTTITVGSDTYSVPAGSIVGTSAYTGSQSVSVAAPVNTAFTASTMPSASSWQSVAYGNGYFVAVQNSGTTAGAYSTDGISWTASTMPSGGSTAGWNAVGYGNGYFVAVAYGTTAGAYSTNGTSWTASTMPSSSNWYGVTYGNGYYVAVQSSGTTAGASSTNGTTWTARTMPSASQWWGVTYGLVGATPTYVAVAASTTAGAYSTNGTSWTALRMSIASNWQSVTYGNGYFVAVQNSGSTAGAYFAQSTLPVAYGIYNGATVRA